jgi:hypothetical protein
MELIYTEDIDLRIDHLLGLLKAEFEKKKLPDISYDITSKSKDIDDIMEGYENTDDAELKTFMEKIFITKATNNDSTDVSAVHREIYRYCTN